MSEVSERKGRAMASAPTRPPTGRGWLAMFQYGWDRVRNATTSSPARFVVLVFAILILLFTLMLSLPAAASDGRRTAFADALFTAGSTICETGLSPVAMATHWSPSRSEERRVGTEG